MITEPNALDDLRSLALTLLEEATVLQRILEDLNRADHPDALWAQGYRDGLQDLLRRISGGPQAYWQLSDAQLIDAS